MNYCNPMERHPNRSSAGSLVARAGSDVRAGVAVKRALSIRSPPSTPSFKLKNKMKKNKNKRIPKKTVVTVEETAGDDDGIELQQRHAKNANAGEKGGGKGERWESAVDSETGATYYFSRETGETRWTRPEE